MPYSVRAECADLIEHVRSLVGEAAGSDCEAVNDGDVQRFLDDTREPVRYVPVYCDFDIAPGGGIVYLRFEGEKWMDAGAKVLSQNYTPLSKVDGDQWDPLRGLWLFEASQSPILYLVGNRYDVYLAAANALRKIQADNKYSVDTADQSVKTYDSQALATMARLEASYRSQARIGFVEFSRSDI